MSGTDEFERLSSIAGEAQFRDLEDEFDGLGFKAKQEGLEI